VCVGGFWGEGVGCRGCGALCKWSVGAGGGGGVRVIWDWGVWMGCG
jgi:hypothetical protein